MLLSNQGYPKKLLLGGCRAYILLTKWAQLPAFHNSASTNSSSWGLSMQSGKNVQTETANLVIFDRNLVLLTLYLNSATNLLYMVNNTLIR